MPSETPPQSQRIEDFVIRPRHSVRERELARRLRELPEEDRFTFIRTLLDKDFEVGLVLASACLRDKNYFKAILDYGLKNHSSRIELFLKRVIPRLGFRKVLHLITDKLSTEPKAVEHAAYYLWVFRPKNDLAAYQGLLKLNDLLRARGLRTPPSDNSLCFWMAHYLRIMKYRMFKARPKKV